MSKHTIKFSLLAVAILLFAIAGFFWQESRKEVFYLCGNFAKGVSVSDVVKQLETAHLLEYQYSQSNTLVVTGVAPFKHYQCTIEFDQQEFVVKAWLD